MDIAILMFIVFSALAVTLQLFRLFRKSYLKELEASGVALYRRIKEDSTCSFKKEPHEWEEVKLTNNGTVRKEQVCCKCGLIFGSDDQFTEDGIKKLQDKRKEVAENITFYEELENYKNAELLRLGLYEEVNGGSARSFQAGYDSYTVIEEALKVKISDRAIEKVLKLMDRDK